MPQTTTHTHRIGLNRRELLQVGYSALLGVSALAPAVRAAQGSRQPRSVILVFLTGASSHIDTFDPKPDAPAEVRGEFGVTRTPVPGLQVCEHLPLLAARATQYAVVRSLAHRDNNHTAATHHLITGSLQPGVRFDKPLSRDDWPCYAAGVSFLRPPQPGVPAGVTLPTFLQEGPLVWPGQHGGFLGPRHDPWQINRDPNVPDFRVDNLRPPAGLDVNSLNNRLALLGEVNRQQQALAASAEARRFTEQQGKAVALLTSGKVAQAFDLDREPQAIRDRYGRHLFGQSLLLARRLVEAGVPVVQANMGRVQNWDTHGANFVRLKKELLPPLDRGVSALLDDLAASGLLADTLVVVIGEFGRTPKVDVKNAGRDHWAQCFCGVFAGGSVVGGQIVGKSDKVAAYPVTTPYSPDDVGDGV
ncbi:MAG: DUF1501 domain-containing protein [Gemmataceae bacterium]